MGYEAALRAEPFRGRRSKFTPERIQQIRELVKSGISCEEIAAFIGVTSGALKVSCSRLGVSLRRPRAIEGNGSLLCRTAMSTKMAAGATKFAVIVRYHGEEHATELQLTASMIGRLALEASSRGLTMSELAGMLVMAVTKQGLVHRVLEG